jgi:hypothetical protein
VPVAQPPARRRPLWLWLVAAAVLLLFILAAAAADQWFFALVGVFVAAVAVAPLFARR